MGGDVCFGGGLRGPFGGLRLRLGGAAAFGGSLCEGGGGGAFVCAHAHTRAAAFKIKFS